tara:strand:+ start:654 stop:857 length:204 start_codon:yes stop_codon:yes gene_type:complete
MTKQELHDGNSEGSSLGSSTSDLISFHGKDPVDIGAIVTLTSSTLGVTNVAVAAIIALLKEKGLMAE